MNTNFFKKDKDKGSFLPEIRRFDSNRSKNDSDDYDSDVIKKYNLTFRTPT